MKKISTYHDIQLRITQKAHYGILISIVVLVMLVMLMHSQVLPFQDIANDWLLTEMTGVNSSRNDINKNSVLDLINDQGHIEQRSPTGGPHVILKSSI